MKHDSAGECSVGLSLQACSSMVMNDMDDRRKRISWALKKKDRGSVCIMLC